MEYKVIILRNAMRVLKLVLTPIACWPLPINSSRSEILKHQIFWYFSLFIGITTSYSQINGIYESRNFSETVEISSQLLAMAILMFKLLICKLYHSSLQVSVAEFERFTSCATPEEMEFAEDYLQKCVNVHLCFFVCCILGPISFMCSPVASGRSLPAAGTYAFSIEPTWIWLSLYVHQSMIIWLVGCAANLDLFFVTMLWMIVVRFELLGSDFSRVTSLSDVRRCIARQQMLIDYSNRLTEVIRWIVLMLNCIIIVGVAMGGVFIISLFFVRIDRKHRLILMYRFALWRTKQKPSIVDALKFLLMVGDAVSELVLYNWVAENLSSTSEKIAYAIYQSDWIGKSPELLLDMRIVMQRSQQPVQIQIDGILPMLSLEFLGKCMVTIISYITTLRAFTTD